MSLGPHVEDRGSFFFWVLAPTPTRPEPFMYQFATTTVQPPSAPTAVRARVQADEVVMAWLTSGARNPDGGHIT